MMSAGGGASAGNGLSYYYQKDPMTPEDKQNGQWVGNGAESLGLVGNVDFQDFSRILNGQDPQNGDQLVQPKTGEKLEDRRAYNDYTFSAPKSVSVAMAAGVEGLKEAHDAAVLAVAQHMQEHYSQARTPDGIQNGSFVATKFDHFTSRALDPQLHSHLVGHNMTQTADGKWRANEPLNVFKDQKALGELYRQELAHQLQQQGQSIEWTDRGAMLFEIKGVPEAAIREFSSRREAIEEQVKTWKAEGAHKGVSDAKLHEMAALGTRATKDKEVTKERVEQLWKEGFEKSGTSAEQIKSNIDTAKRFKQSQEQEAQKEGQPPEKLTAEKAVSEAARILTDKEAVIDRAQLLRTAAQISGGQHSIKELSAAVESQTERIGQDYKGREKYTTQEIRELEAKNVETLKNLGEYKSVTSKQEVEQYLSKIEKTENIKLSAGQRQHVINELAGNKALAVTQGDPGTGKTFASSIVERFNNEVLKPSGREHYTINVAFTGKAASEMSDASGKPAYTISSFLNLYAAGKIQIGEPAQARDKDQSTMEGVKQAAAAGLQHQAKADQLKQRLHSVTSAERLGSANNSLWEIKGGNISFRGTANGVEAEHRTSKDVGLGIRQTNISRDNADGSHTSSTTYRHGNQLAGTREEAGTVKRNDGSKIEYKSERQSYLGGLITRGLKIEKEPGELVKISKTSTFGSTIKGTTTTVDRLGNARETVWEGTKGKNGIEISKSETRRFTDKKLADKHLLSAGERVTKGFLSAVSALSNDARRESEEYTRNAWQQAKGGMQPEKGRPEVSPQQISDIKGQQVPVKPEVVIPRGAQVVLKIDEASFVGAKDAALLMKFSQEMQEKGVQVKTLAVGDTKQMQAIQAGDFFRQAQTIAQSGKGDFAAIKEINRQKDPELLKTAEELNKDGNAKQLGANAVKALEMLKSQGRTTEIKDREQLVKATVERYLSEAAKPSLVAEKAAAGEKQSVLLVTALNRDRMELNQAIREARIEAGQIQRGQTYQVHVAANTGPTADSYRPGMQVQFTGERDQNDVQMRSWGAPLQSVGTVQSINTDKNSVRIMYEVGQKDGSTKHITKEFNATEMQNRVSAFSAENREFATGDRVVFLLNDKKGIGVTNGQMAEIKSIDDKGNVTARIDGQKDDKVFNLSTYRNIDHGYAVTTEKSQGATVNSAIVFAGVKEDGKGARETYNALNVAITRATHEAHVMTTSEKGLGVAAERVAEKSTTVGKEQMQEEKAETRPEKDQDQKQQSEKAQPEKSEIEKAERHLENKEATKEQTEKRSEVSDKLDKLEAGQQEAKQSLQQEKSEQGQQQEQQNNSGQNQNQSKEQSQEKGQQQQEKQEADKNGPALER